MLFSYNLLQSFFAKKLPKPEKLAEILTMHSFEIPNSKFQTEKDWILDIDVLPNRAPDCLSHLGVAREISAITGLKYRGDTPVNLRGTRNLRTKDFIKVEVLAKKDCPRYTARVVADVKVAPSPRWIRERLMVCGLNPINNIVDIANYVMLETGQPLHAFDFSKIESVNSKFQMGPKRSLGGRGAGWSPNSKLKTIIIRKAKRGEQITTLDGEKYDLDEDILVIADLPGDLSADLPAETLVKAGALAKAGDLTKAGAKEPLAIAGIKGGKKAEIDNKTKIVVLESANFNSAAIRRASKRQILRTDASIRFENGLDPNLAEFAINRAAELIKEIAGGRICQGLIDFYPKKVLPKKIKLDLGYVEKLLGVKIPEKEIIKILKSLGLKIEPRPKPKNQSFQSGARQISLGRGKILNVVIPTFRLDISIPEELIEEIGRIYGYDKIPAVYPLASLIPPKRNLDIFWENAAKDILKEAGFSEVYNYSFLSGKEASIFGFKNIIEVANPISSDFCYLRPSLVCGILENIKKNQRSSGEIKIFELGKIFRSSRFEVRSSKLKLEEKKMLTGLITGDALKYNKLTSGQAFYEAKGVVDLLLNKLGISNIWYDSYQPTPEESEISIWHPNKCAEIKVDHQEIGFLGEISPKLLNKLKMEDRIAVFDIDFELLKNYCSEEHEFRPLSPFPAAVRDIAVLVPSRVLVEDVLNKMEIAGSSLVRDIDLFDIYEGEELPAGKKNLAFHIIYQAEDKTLTSKEIDKIQQKIIKTLEEDPEWEVRK